MSLIHALGSIEKEAFYQEFWEKKVLHVSESSSDRFSDIRDDLHIENIIWRSCREWGDVSLAKSKTNYENVNYGKTQPRYEDILSAYANGFTVVINNMQNKIESVATYCRAIENEIFCRVTANLYVTQKESQGLDPHYDDDDVIVLQLEGKKLWNIYNASSENSLPLRDSDYLEPIIPNEPINQYLLSKGDLLYVPRGVIHDARSYDEQSMHLTISLRTITWAEVLTKALTTEATKNILLRQSIPTELSKFGKFNQNEFDQLKNILSDIDHESIFNALNISRSELLNDVGEIPSSCISSLTKKVSYESNSQDKYALSNNLIYSLDHREDGVYVTVPSGILNFDDKYDEALMFIFSGVVFAAEDVPEIEKFDCESLLKHLESYRVLERH